MTTAPSTYTPPVHGQAWVTAGAAAVGLDTAKLAAAVTFAEAHDSPWPRTMRLADGTFVSVADKTEKGPWSAVVGPVSERGGPAGLILKGGRIVAEWGDTARADMTFSVTKSYLAILAGLALADGLYGGVDEPLARTVPGEHFAGPHNSLITWRHLLQQTSEWEGELWGKSERIDRNRQIGPGTDNSRKGTHRDLRAPGTFYEYNDVRVNLLAYCLLRRFGRPLPDVLRERVMAPIGASDSWAWHGYETSWTEIGEGAARRRVQSVSGGGHWGGGLFINARDHARVGLLVARRGLWGDRRILPAAWVDAMLTPSAVLASYGFLWWLNRGPGRHQSAPESNVYALGAGNNMIWLDPDHDLVTVLRWIDKGAVDGFLAKLLAACA